MIFLPNYGLNNNIGKQDEEFKNLQNKIKKLVCCVQKYNSVYKNKE